MKFFLFFIFSTAEYIAIFFLTFKMFSMVFKQYTKQVLVSAMIMTLISYFLRKYNLGVYDVMIQLLLFVLFLRLIFRIHTYYSLTMSFAYIVYVITQILIILVLKETLLIDKILSIDSYGAYIIQSLTILSAFLLGMIVKNKELNYNFVPTNLFEKVKLRGDNLMIAALLIIEIAIIGFAYYWYSTNFSYKFLFISLILFIFAGILMRLYNKKEYVI